MVNFPGAGAYGGMELNTNPGTTAVYHGLARPGRVSEALTTLTRCARTALLSQPVFRRPTRKAHARRFIKLLASSTRESGLPTSERASNKHAIMHFSFFLSILGLLQRQIRAILRIMACRIGKGQLLYPSGNKYEGQFINGKRHGQGVFWVQASVTSMVDWTIPLRIIRPPTLYFARRSQDEGRYRIEYNGEWFEGKKEVSPCQQAPGLFPLAALPAHSALTLTFLSWCAGLQGFGVIWSKTGDRYEGEWQEGKRNGKGRQTYGGRFPDGFGGDVYEGDWLHDKRHGQGVFQASRVHSAIWRARCSARWRAVPPAARADFTAGSEGPVGAHSCVLRSASRSVPPAVPADGQWGLLRG